MRKFFEKDEFGERDWTPIALILILVAGIAIALYFTVFKDKTEYFPTEVGTLETYQTKDGSWALKGQPGIFDIKPSKLGANLLVQQKGEVFLLSPLAKPILKAGYTKIEEEGKYFAVYKDSLKGYATDTKEWLKPEKYTDLKVVTNAADEIIIAKSALGATLINLSGDTLLVDAKGKKLTGYKNGSVISGSKPLLLNFEKADGFSDIIGKKDAKSYIIAAVKFKNPIWKDGKIAEKEGKRPKTYNPATGGK